MTGAELEQLQAAVASAFPPGPEQTIGIAVSGGGDSLALMHLLADLSKARAGQLHLRVVTVDHGLRPEAAEEARQVGAMAQSLGVAQDTLTWTGWDGTGNLQDQARRARYGLIREWAAQNGITQVALGHTADDQAETFLLRLARASGVDGLSGMSMRRDLAGMTLVRPFLHCSRGSLRRYLEARGVAWFDDPSNEDEHYDRVRFRKAMAELERLGLTARAIGETARNLASIRSTVGWYAQQEARMITRVEGGDILLERAGFLTLQPEISRRILLQALIWVSGAEYAPRRRSLALALDAVRTSTTMNLHGCNVAVTGDAIRISREFDAVSTLRCPVSDTWDGRWRLTGPECPGAELRALGQEGLAQCDDWRRGGLPYRALLGYPSVWQGDTLIAAPHAGFAHGWQADLLRGEDVFFTSLLAH